MKTKNIIVVVLFGCLIIGCDAKDAKNEKKNEDPQGVIPQQQLRAIEKARGVEKTLLEAEEKRKKSI